MKSLENAAESHGCHGGEDSALAEQQGVPADCDVRKIMLAVVAGEDGMGHEVYAKNISEVEAKLSEMDERLEEYARCIHRPPDNCPRLDKKLPRK